MGRKESKTYLPGKRAFFVPEFGQKRIMGLEHKVKMLWCNMLYGNEFSIIKIPKQSCLFTYLVY